MRDYRRNHKQNYDSPIKAIQICTDIQNHIISIKYFTVRKGISKQHVKNLQNEIIILGGDVYALLRKTELESNDSNKIHLLENTKIRVLYWINLLNRAADIGAIKGKTGMHLANQMHDLDDAIKKWIKYIKQKQNNK